jgi:beta-glucanase (GH16 family)
MEYIGRDSTHAYGSVHGPGFDKTHAYNHGGGFSNDFHTYAVNW